MYYKNWIPGPKMAPIQSNENCSPGTYDRKVFGFRVYFRGLRPTEYAQLCSSHHAPGSVGLLLHSGDVIQKKGSFPHLEKH